MSVQQMNVTFIVPINLINYIVSINLSGALRTLPDKRSGECSSSEKEVPEKMCRRVRIILKTKRIIGIIIILKLNRGSGFHVLHNLHVCRQLLR